MKSKQVVSIASHVTKRSSTVQGTRATRAALTPQRIVAAFRKGLKSALRRGAFRSLPDEPGQAMQLVIARAMRDAVRMGLRDQPVGDLPSIDEYARIVVGELKFVVIPKVERAVEVKAKRDAATESGRRARNARSTAQAQVRARVMAWMSKKQAARVGATGKRFSHPELAKQAYELFSNQSELGDHSPSESTIGKWLRNSGL